MAGAASPSLTVSGEDVQSLDWPKTLHGHPDERMWTNINLNQYSQRFLR